MSGSLQYSTTNSSVRVGGRTISLEDFTRRIHPSSDLRASCTSVFSHPPRPLTPPPDYDYDSRQPRGLQPSSGFGESCYPSTSLPRVALEGVRIDSNGRQGFEETDAGLLEDDHFTSISELVDRSCSSQNASTLEIKGAVNNIPQYSSLREMGSHSTSTPINALSISKPPVSNRQRMPCDNLVLECDGKNAHVVPFSNCCCHSEIGKLPNFSYEQNAHAALQQPTKKCQNQVANQLNHCPVFTNPGLYPGALPALHTGRIPSRSTSQQILPQTGGNGNGLPSPNFTYDDWDSVTLSARDNYSAWGSLDFGSVVVESDSFHIPFCNPDRICRTSERSYQGNTQSPMIHNKLQESSNHRTDESDDATKSGNRLSNDGSSKRGCTCSRYKCLMIMIGCCLSVIGLSSLILTFDFIPDVSELILTAHNFLFLKIASIILLSVAICIFIMA